MFQYWQTSSLVIFFCPLLLFYWILVSIFYIFYLIISLSSNLRIQLILIQYIQNFYYHVIDILLFCTNVSFTYHINYFFFSSHLLPSHIYIYIYVNIKLFYLNLNIEHFKKNSIDNDFYSFIKELHFIIKYF